MPKKRKPKKGVEVLTVINFENRSVTEFISQAEAARQLNLSRATISYLVSEGHLRSHDFAGRKVVLIEDVLAYKPRRPGPKKAANKSGAKTTRKGKKGGSK